MSSDLLKIGSLKQHEIKGIKISIANDEDILGPDLKGVGGWSHGEITKPETINYKTFKIEKKGLFDESIFGPSIDYRCPFCGTKYKKNDEGNFCQKTPECIREKSEILPKIAKRTRMGHIALKAPIVHFWFLKIDHSIIAKLLGLKTSGKNAKEYTKKNIENIVYFKNHVVLDNGDLKGLEKYEIINIQNAPIIYHKALRELIEKKYVDPNSQEHIQLLSHIRELELIAQSNNAKEYGIDFYDYNEILAEFANVNIQSGAEAIEILLSRTNLEKDIRHIKNQINDILEQEKTSAEIKETQFNKRKKLYKRLNIINAFFKSKQKPESMILHNLPIIPSDLRPLIQLDGGRHSTIDANELYRRIIIRNNRLKKWLELDAPILIIQNEKRMLQEAVDALLDNSRKYNPIKGKDGRVLKSIADALDGKKGRFRQNLLGKRVDYSGRSVIVVGPELQLHQAGIPRIMAAKLFEPFIVKRLMDVEIAGTIKAAKKLIEELNPIIWPHVEKAIEGKIVLLNRAPTLHRLSIQAFEPILIRGKAIRLHPLVTTAFNADFDGDQMAVHVPISPEAILEAKELMIANRNILGVKDGEPIINPTQDMILGLYYLTIEKENEKGEGSFYNSLAEAKIAYELGDLSLHARIVIKLSCSNKTQLELLASESKYNYFITTLGKLLLNDSLPETFTFIFNQTSIEDENLQSQYLLKNGQNFVEEIKKLPINKPFDKKAISVVIKKLYGKYSTKITKQEMARIIRQLNNKTINDVEQLLIENEIIRSLNSTTIRIISKSIYDAYQAINKEVAISNQNVERTLEIEEKARVLALAWFNYTSVIAQSLDKIKNLGFEYSKISGSSVSAFDIPLSHVKHDLIKEGENYVHTIEKFCNVDGTINDDERYTLVKNKWEEIKDKIQLDLKQQIDKPTSVNNSIFMMMASGARGNISNFVQLAGMRGLMANNKVIRREERNANILVRNVVEVPVKSSFVEGLTGFEFFSSTHGARKGLTDIALNTANSGYLTRKLVDSAQDVVVSEVDCDSDNGLEIRDIVDTKTKTTIITLKERMIGRFANVDIVHPKTQKVICRRNELISLEISKEIVKSGLTSISIRSILGCHVSFGVCTKCYGVDLSNEKVVNIGEAVGIIAAQSIGEPGTQLTMRTFHTGGVASGAGITDVISGFPRLKELVDATKLPWGRDANSAPIISEIRGFVSEIENTLNGFKVIVTKKENALCKGEERIYEYNFNQKLRVKKGEEVRIAQKLVEGPIILDNLLKIGGQRAIQNYLLKEIQRLYRMQGIIIADKYIEIIIRQMLSKAIVIDQGDTALFNGMMVDVNDLHAINRQAIANNKQPAYVKPTIQGVNKVSLFSNSFLAAASYQETSKILVHAAIKGQIDVLRGLKENIIVGHLIPAGTGISNIAFNSKYDIKSDIELLK